LDQLKQTIVNQTLLPAMWVIVDSFSNDGSFSVATTLFKECPWVHVIGQKERSAEGYSYKNMSAAINDGYAYIKRLSKEQCIVYSYVGKTDATPILEEHYFERLHAEMEADPALAITCGSQRVLQGARAMTVKRLRNLSHSGFNDIRLYRRDFYEEIGGYALTRSPDAVSLAKAARRGWKFKIVESTYFIKPRRGGAKLGLWAGNKSRGKAMYELGYHPLLFALNSLTLTVLFRPHYQILPLTVGYLGSALRLEKRIDDDEIRNYFWKERLREVLRELF
jgi:hypothetical protein